MGTLGYNGRGINSLEVRGDYAYMYLKAISKDTQIYSDHTTSIMWLLNRPVHTLPSMDNIEEWMEKAEDGYIAFFRDSKPNESIMSPFEAYQLEKQGRLKLIKRFPDGKVIYEKTAN